MQYQVPLLSTTSAITDIVLEYITLYGQLKQLVLACELCRIPYLEALQRGEVHPSIQNANQLLQNGLTIWATLAPILPGVTNLDRVLEALDARIPVYVDSLQTGIEHLHGRRVLEWVAQNYPLLIGFVIGVDRGRKRRPAGVKTHVMVCIGSAMVMIISQYISQNLGYGGDIGRMGAQVISGIGFLGAGTILITGQNYVRGLTTAAGLWRSACVGLGAGIGFYDGVLIACGFIAVVLMILPRFSSYIYGKTRLLDFYLEVEEPNSIGEVIACIKSTNCKISSGFHSLQYWQTR